LRLPADCAGLGLGAEFQPPQSRGADHGLGLPRALRRAEAAVQLDGEDVHAVAEAVEGNLGGTEGALAQRPLRVAQVVGVERARPALLQAVAVEEGFWRIGIGGRAGPQVALGQVRAGDLGAVQIGHEAAPGAQREREPPHLRAVGHHEAAPQAHQADGGQEGVGAA